MSANKELVNEINNLMWILEDFCSKTEQTAEINAIISLVKCIHEKTEVLYMNL